jgi:hypothetical protein
MHILKKENEHRLVEIIEQTPGNPDRDTVMCGITKEGIRALLVRIKAEFEAGTFSHDLRLTHETLKGAKELSDITMDHVVHM